MNAAATVTLKHPVTVDGTKYETLGLRRMKARDALVGEGETNETMAGFKMFAALADVPVEVILDLDMEDLTELAAKVAPLMGKRGVALMKKMSKAPPSPGET